jgi:hypothetical protein
MIAAVHLEAVDATNSEQFMKMRKHQSNAGNGGRPKPRARAWNEQPVPLTFSVSAASGNFSLGYFLAGPCLNNSEIEPSKRDVSIRRRQTRSL